MKKRATVRFFYAPLFIFDAQYAPELLLYLPVNLVYFLP